MIQQLNCPTQPQFSIPVEVLKLAHNKEAVARALNWANGEYDRVRPFSAEDIETYQYKGDMFRFILTNNRGAIPMSAEQFVEYHRAAFIWDMETDEVEDIPSTVDTFNGVPVDVIEMEVDGIVETRMGWLETDWEGVIYPHIFFQDGDDQKAWNNHYLKSVAIEQPQPSLEELEEIEYIRSLELAMYA